MLKPACRVFRLQVEVGRPHSHRLECPQCDAFATALESAAGLGSERPLPASLEASLRRIPNDAATAPPALERPLPPLQAPPGLLERLRRLGRPRRGAVGLPLWILDARYAVAASYLLTVMIGFAVGNPASVVTTAAPKLEDGARHTLAAVLGPIEGLDALFEDAYRTSRLSLAAASRIARERLRRLAGEAPAAEEIASPVSVEATPAKGENE